MLKVNEISCFFCWKIFERIHFVQFWIWICLILKNFWFNIVAGFRNIAGIFFEQKIKSFVVIFFLALKFSVGSQEKSSVVFRRTETDIFARWKNVFSIYGKTQNFWWKSLWFCDGRQGVLKILIRRSYNSVKSLKKGI